MYQTLALTVAGKRCFFVTDKAPSTGLRIGLPKESQQDAWLSAAKAATRHFRRIHRGAKWVIVCKWVGELGCSAWVVRKQ